MVLGICLSFPKMGSSLNSYVSPKLASAFGTEGNWNVAGPIFVGAGLMAISLVLAVGTSEYMQYWLLLIGRAILMRPCTMRHKFWPRKDR
jgi:hypothetical protein